MKFHYKKQGALSVPQKKFHTKIKRKFYVTDQPWWIINWNSRPKIIQKLSEIYGHFSPKTNNNNSTEMSVGWARQK